MRDLGNKLILFAICSYMLLSIGQNTFSTVALLLALIVSSLCSFFEDSVRTDALSVIYCLFCLARPELGLYLPIVLYDVRPARRHLLPLITVCAAGVYTLFWIPDFLLFPYLITLVCGAMLSVYSRQLNRLRRQLHRERDDSRENAILLQERNQSLIQQQDYEIYVATLSERNRIAREIHDNVGHMLTRSILQTGALKVINKDPVLEDPLTTLNDTLNTAMTSIRTSVHDLHDESIDLRHALQDAVSGIEHPKIRLEYDMGNTLPKDLKYAFISIVKEAVNNMQKHSDADTAQITVREHPGFYHMQIRDNGSAKNVPAGNDGIGLTNMRERVRALKGMINITTEHGFCINISVMKNSNI